MASIDNDDILVEVITNEEDFPEAFECLTEAFGRQMRDGIWTAFNPGWETAEGQAAGAERMARRWRSVATDNKGRPHTIFLKATIPDPERPGRRRIAGFAIWVQATAVEGHGDLTTGEPKMDLDALYPGDEREQRFLRQMLGSMFRRRVEYVGAKAAADPPAVMVLDLCATHPAYQRRGVASRLVRWGLDEAARRGIPDATTEASSMGRHAYAKLGFKPRGEDIAYELDEEFRGRDQPPNLFMVYSRDSE